MFSLGLEGILGTPGKIIPHMDPSEAMLVGIESIQVLNDMQLEIDNCDKFIESVDEVNNLISVIETCGIDKSLVMVFGKELEKIAPGINAAKPDKDTVLSELSISMEGVVSNIKNFIKTMIAKFIEFIKRILANTDKISSQINDLNVKAKESNKSDKDIGEVEVLGLTNKSVSALYYAAEKGGAASKKLFDDNDKGVSKEDLVNTFNKVSLVTMGFSIGTDLSVTKDPKFWKKEKKSLNALGWNKTEILKASPSVIKALAELRDMQKQITDMKNAVSKMGENEGEAGATYPLQKIISVTIKGGNITISSTITIAMQQIAMLKAII